MKRYSTYDNDLAQNSKLANYLLPAKENKRN